MAKFKYKTIDTSTDKGLKQAEKLHAAGWKLISNGFYLMTFERKTSK